MWVCGVVGVGGGMERSGREEGEGEAGRRGQTACHITYLLFLQNQQVLPNKVGKVMAVPGRDRPVLTFHESRASICRRLRRSPHPLRSALKIQMGLHSFFVKCLVISERPIGPRGPGDQEGAPQRGQTQTPVSPADYSWLTPRRLWGDSGRERHSQGVAARNR